MRTSARWFYTPTWALGFTCWFQAHSCRELRDGFSCEFIHPVLPLSGDCTNVYFLFMKAIFCCMLSNESKLFELDVSMQNFQTSVCFSPVWWNRRFLFSPVQRETGSLSALRDAGQSVQLLEEVATSPHTDATPAYPLLWPMTPEATMLGWRYDKTGQMMLYMPLASIFIRSEYIYEHNQNLIVLVEIPKQDPTKHHSSRSDMIFSWKAQTICLW